MYDWKQRRAGKFNKMLGLFLDLQPRFGNKATLTRKRKERKKAFSAISTAENIYLHCFNNVNIFLLLNVGAWKFHTQKELLIKILTCETDFTGYTKNMKHFWNGTLSSLHKWFQTP